MKVKERESWLYERYSEFRKLVKVLIQQINKKNSDADVIQSNKDGLNWFDSILSLESMVKSFNLSNFGDGSDDVKPRHIPLCITVLL